MPLPLVVSEGKLEGNPKVKRSRTQRGETGSGEADLKIRESDRERFWRKVDKNGPMHPTDEKLGKCWIWKAGTISDGYGNFRLNGKPMLSHRLSFILNGGIFNNGPFVLHSCHNRRCCSPMHLRSGSNQDNMDDMKAAFRQNKARGDKNGSITKPECLARGEDNPKAKLTNDMVKFIRDIYEPNKTTHSGIAAMVGVSKTAVGRIIRRQIWKHLK